MYTWEEMQPSPASFVWSAHCENSCQPHQSEIFPRDTKVEFFFHPWIERIQKLSEHQFLPRSLQSNANILRTCTLTDKRNVRSLFNINGWWEICCHLEFGEFSRQNSTFQSQLNQFQIATRLKQLSNNSIRLCQVSFNDVHPPAILQISPRDDILAKETSVFLFYPFT